MLKIKIRWSKFLFYYNMLEIEFKQVDEIYIISGEFERCIGLGDL